jgi:hypothetical protein
MTKPWEHESYTEYHDRQLTFRNGKYFRNHAGRPFRATYTTCPDNKKLYYRKGQVVKFGCGFNHYWPRNNWEEWFLTEKEKLKRRPPNKEIPVYARDEYAVVLNRYKWIKQKSRIYQDYGTIVMMITGTHAGHIRKYYVKSPPFNITAIYPYRRYTKTIGGAKIDTEYDLIKTVRNIDYYLDGERSIDTFLSCLYYILNGPNPNEPDIEIIAKAWLTR